MTRNSPPPASERRAGAGTAVLVAAAWVATVVAGNGMTSVATGLEVMPVAQAGPLAEPVGVAVAALLIAVRIGFSTARSVLLPVELLFIAAICAILGPAGIALVASDPGAAFLTAGEAATSAFTVVDALLAAISGLIALLLVRARDAGAGRPRWPWEDDDR